MAAAANVGTADVVHMASMLEAGVCKLTLLFVTERGLRHPDEVSFASTEVVFLRNCFLYMRKMPMKVFYYTHFFIS